MRFEKVQDVSTVVWYLKQADTVRSSNRALINQLFNGDAPYTTREADDNHIDTNVNFLDAAKIAHDARSTFNNAFLKPGNFFTVTLDGGPEHKRSKWEKIITKTINRCLKRSIRYVETLRSEFAQTVLHGIGPSFWEDNYIWCPTPIPIGDILVPARTRVALDNLDYFAVRRQVTYEKLYEMTHGPQVDKGWNMKLVDKLLKEYKDEYLANSPISYNRTPEDFVESEKSDETYYDNEAIPTIDYFDFYFKDNEQEGKWYRKSVLDAPDEKEMSDQFLYSPKRVFSDELNQFLHIMFGDGSNVAPFRYHSVRGLGWLLYAVCHLQNRLRCKFNDAVFEQLLWYFRVTNPEDRERLDKIDLHHVGVIPEGLDFVKAQDRYQFNQAVVGAAFAMNRQTMAESSSQFRQDLNDGTSKEMTAQEAMARMQSSNALVGSMLQLAYLYQGFQYNEIARRFTIKGSLDKDVKKFRDECKKAGVPEEMLNAERWDVQPERVLGAGNKTLEIAQAKEMMAIRNLLDPEPQRVVLHDYIEAITDNPAKADALSPIDKKVVSDSIHDAQLAAGALMFGMPVSMKTGMNHIEYVEALLVSMGSVIQNIQRTGNVGTLTEVNGLANLGSHIAEHIQIIAQDQNEKLRVKRYGDALGQFMNFVKGFAQRLQEKNVDGQELTPEAQAKIQSALILAQSQSKIKEAKAAQQMQQKQQAFDANQQREAQKHNVDLGRVVQETKVDALVTDMKTAADIRAKRVKSNDSTSTEGTV